MTLREERQRRRTVLMYKTIILHTVGMGAVCAVGLAIGQGLIFLITGVNL